MCKWHLSSCTPGIILISLDLSGFSTMTVTITCMFKRSSQWYNFLMIFTCCFDVSWEQWGWPRKREEGLRTMKWPPFTIYNCPPESTTGGTSRDIKVKARSQEVSPPAPKKETNWTVNSEHPASQTTIKGANGCGEESRQKTLTHSLPVIIQRTDSTCRGYTSSTPRTRSL